MEQKAVTGVRWTLMTYAVGKVITLTSTVVLARILRPADFGVVMLAFVAINVVGFFGDLGLGATLVVRQDLNKRGLGTVLTLQMATGGVLAVVLAVAAPFLANVFDEHRLGGVLVALAPITVLGAVSWFYQWLLQRELEFRVRFFGYVAQALVYGVVAVGAAALGAGVWSIVAGHLAGNVAMTAVFVLPGRTRVAPALDRSIVRGLFRTSRGFLLQTSARLLQQNADYVAVGHVLGSAPLGLYSMAFRLAELPYLAVADPVAKVNFPVFTRMRARGEDVTGLYLGALGMVASLTGPLGVLVSATAAPFVSVVYGPRWVPMTGVLAVLGLWGAAKSVQATLEALLNAAGGAQDVGATAVALLALQAPALLVAAQLGGLVAAAWVLVVGVCLSVLVLVARAGRRLGIGFRPHTRVLGPFVLACTGAWLAARGTSVAAAHAPVPVELAASVAAGAAAYWMIVCLLAPGSMRRSLDQIRGTVRYEAPISPEPVRTGAPGLDGAAPHAEALVAPEESVAPAARPPAPSPESS